MKKTPSPPQSLFNKSYYHTFYNHTKTRIRTHVDMNKLAAFVTAYLSYMRLPVKTVLDVGCGQGHWKKHLGLLYPKATFTGIEYSKYACKKYGWIQGSVVDFSLPITFDLVICQSVLQYLNDADAKKAITNLAKHCHGALYVEIITKHDWNHHCDTTVSDSRIHLRSGSWYKKLLSRSFMSAGGGLFISNKTPIVLYELEQG